MRRVFTCSYFGRFLCSILKALFRGYSGTALSVGDMFQDLTQLVETVDAGEPYIKFLFHVHTCL